MAVLAGSAAGQQTPASPAVAADPGGRTVISDTPWTPGLGGEKVVYGPDDRVDVYQEADSARKALAGSVCALMSTDQLTALGGGGWQISASAYRYQNLPACAGEPFGNQPTAAFCTGFLVGPDIVATAGHCYDTTDFAGVRFVFGFEMKDAGTPNLDVADDQVYTGVDLLGHQLDSATKLDYSVIRLDRAVTAPGALPLTIRRSGIVPVDSAVGVIGYPAGLPEKLAFGATTHVVDSSPTAYFVANLDTYGGNSGSPVFNAATGVVEGILVRGNPDFKISGPPNDKCFVSNKLPDSTIDAEQVSKAVTFAQFVPALVAKAKVVLDRSAYSCAATALGITLTDPNAAGATQKATVTSGVGDTETVALNETASGSHTYAGSLPLQTAAVAVEDGILSIADGTSITVLYSDQDNGQGVQANITATAPVDCVAPTVGGVTFSRISATSEMVVFQTDEPATGTIAYATTNCHDANIASVSTASATSHSATLAGLALNTPYFVAITATDAAGNSATSDNSGNCHTFATTGVPPTVKQAAQGLYDGFSAADANQDGVLNLAEAQAVQPDLTAADFSSMDTNQDGTVSKDELASYLNINPGCGCGSGCTPATAGKSLKDWQQYLGDLFLGGLSLAALMIMAGRRPR